MLRFMTCLLMISVAIPASAQQYYAEQTYPTPQTPPQQVSGNYYGGQPYIAPPHEQLAPQPQQAPAPRPAQAQPWDYGQSVTTDIRQMNF